MPEANGREAEIHQVFNQPPELRDDRQGYRIEEVRFHPAYHELMQAAIHSARAAMEYLHQQADSGSGCPLAMTFAALMRQALVQAIHHCRHGHSASAEAFCGSRLAAWRHYSYGTLGPCADAEKILDYAWS